MVYVVLPALHEQPGQQRQHRQQAYQQPTATNDPHFLDALEICKTHRQKRAGRRKGARKNPPPGEHHRPGERSRLFAAMAQFLLVSRYQMHSEINRQANQDRHKGDRQYVQMTNHERRKRKRVADTDEQAYGGLYWTARFPVAIDENKRAKHQRHHTRHHGVGLRLLHFVFLKNGLPRKTHVEPWHLCPCLLHQLPQTVHSLSSHRLSGRLGGHQKYAPLVKGNVDPLVCIRARVEQCRHTRRRRHSGPVQTLCGLRNDSLERGQRLNHGV